MSKFEICQKLSNEIYKDYVKTDIEGWELVVPKKADSAGLNKINVYKKGNFAAAAYKKGDEIIIVFRGTDDKKDLIEDVRIALSKGLKTDVYAHDFTNMVLKEYPNCKLIFTGHSLGGAYAQLACVKNLVAGKACCGYTFNAPGMKDYLDKKAYKGDFNPAAIENYVVMNDFIGNYRGHAGYTYYFQPFRMDMADEKGGFESPHGCIIRFGKEVLGDVISKEYLKKFGSKNGLALWCWDVKNNTDEKYKSILKQPIRVYHLTDAIQIIKNCSKLTLKNKFEYKAGKIVLQLP